MARKQSASISKKAMQKYEEGAELATGSGASEHQASTDESSHRLDSRSMMLLVNEQKETFEPCG